MKMKKLQNEYFFCYNKTLAGYLRYDEGFEFITKARNPNTDSIVTIFEKTEELQEALDRYAKTESEKLR